jgi:serine/threonine protein kinase
MDAWARLNAAFAGRYAVERELGAGGMATVYLTRDLRHDRHVALKVLHAQLAHALGAERFLHEIRVTARLEHPHILTLIDSGEVPAPDGTGPPLLYYVMPYVEGESLRGRLTRERQLPLADAVRLVAQVADALGYAHDRGIVHRDIKPENILLSGEHVKVADFGIARATEAHTGALALTATGVVVGTPAYMSPEQIVGEREIDGRSDLYSLACVLYEMLAGQPPFAGATLQGLLARRLTEEAPRVTSLRPAVPPMVDMVLARALSTRREERHASTREFGRALLAEISGTSIAIASRESEGPGRSGKTPFVAREKELAELRTHVANLACGVGGVVLIGGEPGVGKTRLAETAMQEARAARALCLTGHCMEMQGAAAPYAPFTELFDVSARLLPPRTLREALGDAAPEIARVFPALRQAFPDIPPPIELPPEQQRRYFFARYREFNERASRVAPIVALLDDLHWADDASLLLLANLATYVESMPILIIGTYRDVDLEVNRPFARTLEDLTRQRRAHRITLRRLSEDGTRSLLAALGGAAPPPALAALFHHETEGNPFFVEEVFRHLEEEGRLFDADRQWRADLLPEQLDVPEGVKLVIGRRLERLSADTRAVLTSAALIGPRFSLRVLQALDEVPGDGLLDALDAAVRARVIDEATAGRDMTYAFAHELIRHTLVSSVSLPRRQRRHLRIADAVERTYGERIDTRAADMAYHLYHAGAAADADRTCRFLVLAAEQALARAAFDDALLHSERGLEGADELTGGQRARLLRIRGLALRGQGCWPEAAEALGAALELFGRSNDAVDGAVVALDLAYLTVWQGAFSEAAKIAARGRAVLEDQNSPLAVRLCALHAALVASTGDYDAGMAGFAEAHAAAPARADALLDAHVSSYEQAMRYNYGEFERQVEIGAAAAAIFRQHGERGSLGTTLELLCSGLAYTGRLDEADAAVAELEPIAQELGLVGPLVMLDFVRSLVRFVRSGDHQALASITARSADAFARTGGPWRHSGAAVRATGMFFGGEWREAAALARTAALGLAEVPVWSGFAWGVTLQAEAYADPVAARATWQETSHRLPRPGRPAFGGSRLMVSPAIDALATMGLLAEAASAYGVAVETIGRGLALSYHGLPECAAAIAAAAGDNWNRAEHHFATAHALAHALPHRVAQPEVRRWQAWMLRRRNAPGDSERAAMLLGEALALYREIGMAGHVALVEAALADMG